MVIAALCKSMSKEVRPAGGVLYSFDFITVQWVEYTAIRSKKGK